MFNSGVVESFDCVESDFFMACGDEELTFFDCEYVGESRFIDMWEDIDGDGTFCAVDGDGSGGVSNDEEFVEIELSKTGDSFVCVFLECFICFD